jgi:murein DD-endopeptidase MepM/ murein hydrolase activator NlpD
MHQGIDILVPKGTPVQAAAAGVVAEAREYNGYGQTVILKHEDGTRTLYAHCSELTVRKGDKVERGQVIAHAGDTGRATAYHVHFGVMVSGVFQDPMTRLPKGPRQFVRQPRRKKEEIRKTKR